MTAFAKGQKVKVFPHGSPHKSAVGEVIIIAGSQQSIGLSFDDVPPFLINGFAAHPVHGIVFLAWREKIGPWVEVFGQGHYEIEAL